MCPSAPFIALTMPLAASAILRLLSQFAASVVDGELGGAGWESSHDLEIGKELGALGLRKD